MQHRLKILNNETLKEFILAELRHIQALSSVTNELPAVKLIEEAIDELVKRATVNQLHTGRA